MTNIDRLPPRSAGVQRLRAARLGLYVDAALWLVVGMVLMWIMPARGASWPLAALLAALMAANAAVLFFFGWKLGQGRRFWFWPAVAYLAVNLVLTFADEFGAADFAFLVVEVALLALVWRARPYLQSGL